MCHCGGSAVLLSTSCKKTLESVPARCDECMLDSNTFTGQVTAPESLEHLSCCVSCAARVRSFQMPADKQQLCKSQQLLASSCSCASMLEHNCHIEALHMPKIYGWHSEVNKSSRPCTNGSDPIYRRTCGDSVQWKDWKLNRTKVV